MSLIRSSSPLLRLGALGATIVLLTAATPALFGRLGDNFFIAQAIACGVLTIVATRVAESCSERKGLVLIIGVAILLRLILLPALPLTSDDIFRYVWDGRVQAAGINPYRYVPVAEELANLRDHAIFSHINRKEHAVTIYPPAAQIFFVLVTRLHESVTIMKAALVAFEAVTILAVIALLRRRGWPATRVVAYAWHPLAIWEIANNGHIDGAMVAMMMLALWLFASGRVLSAGVAAAVAALFKPFAVLVLPAFWRPWDWRLPLATLGTVALLYGPYLSVGTGVLGFLPSYVGEERLDSGSAFWALNVIQSAFGPLPWAQSAYGVAALLILSGLALRAGFRIERTLAITLNDISALLLAFSFLLSPDYPWYFLMVVPFVALTGSPAGWALTIGGFALYDLLAWDPQIHFVVRDTALNLLVIAMIIRAALGAWRARTASFSGAFVSNDPSSRTSSAAARSSPLP
jgi:alpha-1,6-mannosyltransferase